MGFVKSVKCRVNKLERGVIIFYKKDLKIEEVKNIKYDTEEWKCVGIKIKNILGNDKIVILGVYRKPEMNTTIGIWRKFIDLIEVGSNIIIAGDINAHNVIWNYDNMDRNGEILQEEMEERNMIIDNDEIKSRTGKEGVRNLNIDLLFATRNIYQYLKCA